MCTKQIPHSRLDWLMIIYTSILVIISVAEPEPPLLGRSRSQFFFGSEPGAGAAFFMAAPAASSRQAEKKSLRPQDVIRGLLRSYEFR